MWECRISCKSSAYFTESFCQHSLHSLLILTCFGQGNIQHRTQRLMVHSNLKLQNSAQHLKWSWWGHLMEVKNLLNCWVINAFFPQLKPLSMWVDKSQVKVKIQCRHALQSLKCAFTYISYRQSSTSAHINTVSWNIVNIFTDNNKCLECHGGCKEEHNYKEYHRKVFNPQSNMEHSLESQGVIYI